MKRMTVLFLAIAALILSHAGFSQDKPVISLSAASVDRSEYLTKRGTILSQMPLIKERYPLGVTVANGKIVITSSDGKGGNYFDVYDFSGNHLSSTPQGTTTDWGYRDLAFDGSYILASDDSTIKKIDPTDFHVVSQIKNSAHSPHRGLAYDPGSNAIYSTNFRHGNLVKIDAATGATLETLAQPSSAPYGIAFDHYSYSDAGFLWYAEPSYYGKFRVTRVDTSTGNFDFSYDLTSSLPDSALSGGLEIFNNHLDYPDSIVALMVDQHNHKLLFVDITNTPLTFPTNVEYVNDFGGFDETGLDINSMQVYSGYLFAVNNERSVRIFDVKTNPAQPAVAGEVPIGDGLDYLAVHNDALFAPYAPQLPDTVMVFNISDPLNWTLKSQFIVNERVVGMKFYGNYAFVITQNEAKVHIYDISDLNNIQLKDSILTPDNCYSIETDASKGLLFVGYGKTTTGFSVYDVSSPLAPKELGKTTDLWHTPMKMTLADSNHIITLTSENANTGGFWYLECFDISDFSNISKAEGLAMTSAWDMKIIDGVILVSSTDFPNKGVRMYAWDNTNSTFRKGGLMEFDHAELIAAYSPPAGGQTFLGKRNGIQSNFGNENHHLMDWNPRETYYYFSRGDYVYWPYSYGSEKGKIFRTKKPTKPTKAALAIDVKPLLAKDAGCTTEPAPGTHSYDMNTVVPLKAKEVKSKGWYFKEWTGDVSGTDLNVSVTMDKDKSVVANFVNLLLEVTGYQKKRLVCPDSARKGFIKMLPIHLTASDDDDWEVGGLNLVTSGSGNEGSDVDSIVVLKNNAAIYGGKFASDDETKSVTFNPPLTIPAGKTVTVVLKYSFGFDPDFYGQYDVNTFMVSTAGVTAKPKHYKSGLILGYAKCDTLTIARVINATRKKGFARIQEGINSPTTKDGDSLFVCGGIYDENIVVNKKLTICGESTYATILQYQKQANAVGFKITTDSVTIENFDIEPDGKVEDSENSSNIEICGPVENHHSIKIIHNRIKGNLHSTNINGIKADSVNNCIIKQNEFPGPLGKFISINKLSNTVISSNIFALSCWNVAIELKNPNHVTINNNRFSNIEEGHYPEFLNISSPHNLAISSNFFDLKGLESDYPIKLSDGIETTISSNSFTNAPADTISKLISLENCKESKFQSNIFDNNQKCTVTMTNSIRNDISKNKYFILELIGGSDHKIQNNILYHVDVSSATDKVRNTKILGNRIYSAKDDAGISLSKAQNTMIERNRIYHNEIMGIYLVDCDGAKIRRNKIWDNGRSGIEMTNSRHIIISDNFIKHHLTRCDYGGTIGELGGSGIFGNYVNGYSIYGNSLIGNCTGINLFNCMNGRVVTNIIMNNLCLFTGIHLDNSSPNIAKNNIANNKGDGIFATNASNPVITFNNIVANGSHGINNADPNISLNAQNNWWGSGNGPGENGTKGNVNATPWLSSPDSLVVSAAVETFWASPADTDSVLCTIVNWQDSLDVFDVTFSDEKGWLAEPKQVQVGYEDSLLAGAFAHLNIPSNVAVGHSDWVRITVQSQKHPSLTAVDSFLVAVGQQRLQRIAITPDSATVTVGDSLTFRACGFDQFGKRMTIAPLWSATGGSIDQNGLYIAGDSSGVFSVTAEDTATHIKQSARVTITPKTNVNGHSPELPKEYALYQNYPNPFNPSTTIQYALPFESKVKLEIFNTLGHRVHILMDGIEPAGYKEIRWNASRFSSGIYLIRLTAIPVRGRKESYSSVKKIMFLK